MDWAKTTARRDENHLSFGASYIRDFTVHWGRDKMDTILRMTVWNIFASMKMFEFWYVTEVWQVSIGSGNGLASNRQEVITWSRDDPVQWHIRVSLPQWVNTLRQRQNGCRFADDTFKRIFLNENVRISINISLKFVPKGPINNNPALVQIMAWRRSGDKPLSEPMMVCLLTHICITRPQWVKLLSWLYAS